MARLINILFFYHFCTPSIKYETRNVQVFFKVFATALLLNTVQAAQNCKRVSRAVLNTRVNKNLHKYIIH